MEALDWGYDIDCMDYQKVFDTVPHRRFLKQLEAMTLPVKLITGSASIRHQQETTCANKQFNI